MIYERGVDSNGFAQIRSRGDQALFGLRTELIKRKFGVPEGRALADFLPTVNIAAKKFAAELTTVNVQQKDLYGTENIAIEHEDNNKAVRKTMLERGIRPEDLPPAEDTKKVASKLKNEEKKALKNK